jgi:hypothetical protein
MVPLDDHDSNYGMIQREFISRVPMVPLHVYHIKGEEKADSAARCVDCSPPGDFPNYAAGTWGPEATQWLLAKGHSRPLPTELVGLRKKKGKNS